MEQLEGVLGIPIYFILKLADEINENVIVITKPKKNGGVREICKPSTELKQVQRAINKQVLQKVLLPKNLHGSVPTRSPKTNALQHVGKSFVFALDIKDFYPSIHFTKIQKIYTSLGCSEDVAKLLTRLSTFNGHLAQGFPTSSTLANLILSKITPRLDGICKKHELTYTLYQDDLTISGGYRALKLFNLLLTIFKQEGLELHTDEKKKKCMPRTNRQAVTGWVVNYKVNISKDEYRSLRAILHLCKVKGVDNMVGDKSTEKFLQHLRGRIQRVLEVNPKRGEQLFNDFMALTQNIPENLSRNISSAS